MNGPSITTPITSAPSAAHSFFSHLMATDQWEHINWMLWNKWHVFGPDVQPMHKRAVRQRNEVNAGWSEWWITAVKQSREEGPMGQHNETRLAGSTAATRWRDSTKSPLQRSHPQALVTSSKQKVSTWWERTWGFGGGVGHHSVRSRANSPDASPYPRRPN